MVISVLLRKEKQDSYKRYDRASKITQGVK